MLDLAFVSGGGGGSSSGPRTGAGTKTTATTTENDEPPEFGCMWLLLAAPLPVRGKMLTHAKSGGGVGGGKVGVVATTGTATQQQVIAFKRVGAAPPRGGAGTTFRVRIEVPRTAVVHVGGEGKKTFQWHLLCESTNMFDSWGEMQLPSSS
jgi:hypothetical protein